MKAEELFNDGNIAAVCVELQKLPQKETAIISGYIAKLRERVLLEQAINAIKSHVSLLSVSLS